MALAANRGSRSELEIEAEALAAELRALPEQLRTLVDLHDQRWLNRFATTQDVISLGRGINYPIVLEGALKRKEINYQSQPIVVWMWINPTTWPRSSRWSNQLRRSPVFRRHLKSSMAMGNPCSSEIFGVHPMLESRLTFNCFFGVPSGLVSSLWIEPLYPTIRAMCSANSLIDRSKPVPTFKNDNGLS